jgi:hypothetical protein
VRRYVISIDGVGDGEFVAPSASKARYKAYVAIRETGRHWSFKDFLDRCYTLHLGKPHEV